MDNMTREQAQRQIDDWVIDGIITGNQLIPNTNYPEFVPNELIPPVGFTVPTAPTAPTAPEHVENPLIVVDDPPTAPPAAIPPGRGSALDPAWDPCGVINRRHRWYRIVRPDGGVVNLKPLERFIWIGMTDREGRVPQPDGTFGNRPGNLLRQVRNNQLVDLNIANRVLEGLRAAVADRAEGRAVVPLRAGDDPTTWVVEAVEPESRGRQFRRHFGLGGGGGGGGRGSGGGSGGGLFGHADPGGGGG